MPIQARTEFAAAINQIASEKGVDTNVVIEAIQQAALAAYRKDLSLRGEAIPEDFDSLTAKIDSGTGEISIYRGEENITPPGFARIAAQTAKQVIAQRLHEAEKGAIMEEYDKKVGTIVSGMIQRQEGNTYFIDLGRAEGLMPPSEQTRDEVYIPNQRMKFYIKEIREGGRGPEVIVSRSDANLVKGLFALEVPEIQSGAVEIKEIAREAGGRTKLAAISHQDGVDPVGSLVGQKGVRVQAVTNELGDEKIDIVSYSDDPARFIASALAPAKDIEVYLNEEDEHTSSGGQNEHSSSGGQNKIAKVKVADDQLSLAIGKGGQNVRLAAKLTGWKIDIEGTGESQEEEEGEQKKERPTHVEASVDEGTKEDKDVVEDSGQVAAANASNDDKSTEPEVVKTEEPVKDVDVADEQVPVVDNLDEVVPEELPEEDAKAFEDAQKDMEEEESSGENLESGEEKELNEEKPSGDVDEKKKQE